MCLVLLFNTEPLTATLFTSSVPMHLTALNNPYLDQFPVSDKNALYVDPVHVDLCYGKTNEKWSAGVFFRMRL